METSHFLYVFFGGENHTFFFFWTHFPLFPLLSGAARLTVSGIRKPLGEEEFSGTLPWPLDLQL